MSAPCVFCGRPEAEHGPPGASPLGGPDDRLCPVDAVSSQFYAAPPASVRRVLLELDEDDHDALQAAFATHQSRHPRPDGGSNLAGCLVAEICRGWLEMLGRWPTRGDT